jgi:cellulose synthase/poly-beta-1,6-N-acetylglucosamine synthase-like glycosyltransferase
VRFGAGSWVGASALIRCSALRDIVEIQEERGHPVAVYIRDRTLTEDTDTTVALIRKGWRVHNEPDRMAYSATPPDFGALLIQRRRWATGGLIILADLWRYLARHPSARLGEALIRAQYILGAPVGSIACGALIVCPFEKETLWTAWSMPAFCGWLLIYARDLRHNGRRAADLFRAVALHAMLLPINLAGALHSIG